MGFGYGGGGGGDSAPFSDGTALVKGSADSTKLLRFEVDGFTTGVTRVATFPNANITVAGTNIVNAWDAFQIFSTDFGIALGGTTDVNNFLQWDSTQTPTTGMLYAGSTANSWVIAETADSSFNFAHPLQTNPTLFIHSANQSTTEYNSLAAYGTKTELFKALTAAVATTFVTIGIASGTVCGGTVTYSIFATDGTDHQCRSGVLPFSLVNKADAETGTVGTVGAATEVVAVSSGTLTNTFTIAVGSNAMVLQANAASSLTETTLRIYYHVTLCGPGTVTPA